MAGRGVDIKLGPDVAELGGLLVIGTEHHEARRIDNQLRGRAGRQGDPGETIFAVSAQDDLLRLFGGDKFKRLFSRIENGQALQSRIVDQAIENAQESVELNNYAARKRLFEFDSVLNEQRQVIYALRQMILDGQDLSERIAREQQALLERIAAQHYLGQPADLAAAITPLWPEASELDFESEPDLYPSLAAAYQSRREQFGASVMEQIERQILLLLLDFHWREHLYDMDYLRRGIGLRGLVGIKPITAYQNEGYQAFEELLDLVWERLTQTVMHASLEPVSETQAAIQLAPETL
jgi:preprotein translocase subunit SecA